MRTAVGTTVITRITTKRTKNNDNNNDKHHEEHHEEHHHNHHHLFESIPTVLQFATLFGEGGMSFHSHPKPESEHDQLVIMSYNIWNYNKPWELRHHMIADEVAKTLPDIIAWQEVRYSAWDEMSWKLQNKEDRWGGARLQVEQLASALHSKGLKYHFIYQPAMVYTHSLPDYEIEGLSFFSKYPILDSNFVSLSKDLTNPEDVHQRVCLRALIQTPHGKVNVFVTHMSLNNDSQERNAVEILHFADRYDYPQVLMGDFNCLPNATAIQFLIGNHTLSGKTGNFVDAWATYATNQAPHCDTNGICTQPCTRATHNATCWETHGHTFNVLDDAPTKRIDFVLVRGGLEVEEVRFVGNAPQMRGDNRIMASDHLGLVTKFKNKTKYNGDNIVMVWNIWGLSRGLR